MNGQEPSADLLFRITDITPTPDDDVLAAITAALGEAWPRPVVSGVDSAAPRDIRWRFGERRWRERQIPRQTWGR